MTCTSMSGRACLAIHATAGKTWKRHDSRPASPSRPRPRPMGENCWHGDPPTSNSTPPSGTDRRTWRSGSAPFSR
eukprot:7312601-Alexandrium_andersonii.AAC.1